MSPHSLLHPSSLSQGRTVYRVVLYTVLSDSLSLFLRDIDRRAVYRVVLYTILYSPSLSALVCRAVRAVSSCVELCRAVQSCEQCWGSPLYTMLSLSPPLSLSPALPLPLPILARPLPRGTGLPRLPDLIRLLLNSLAHRTQPKTTTEFHSIAQLPPAPP